LTFGSVHTFVVLLSCAVFLVYVVAQDLAKNIDDNGASSSAPPVVVPSSPSSS
jgi:hypothetical protein